MNVSDYDAAIAEAGGTIDERRWRLAGLAAQARDGGIPQWAERMADNPAVQREPRTVREWAATVDFHAQCTRPYRLLFSHYAAVARKLDRLGLEQAEAMLEQAEAGNWKVRELQMFVSDLTRAEPAPFELSEWPEVEYLRANAALDEAETDEAIAACQRAVEFFDGERARLMQEARP